MEGKRSDINKSKRSDWWLLKNKSPWGNATWDSHFLNHPLYLLPAAPSHWKHQLEGKLWELWSWKPRSHWDCDSKIKTKMNYFYIVIRRLLQMTARPEEDMCLTRPICLEQVGRRISFGYSQETCRLGTAVGRVCQTGRNVNVMLTEGFFAAFLTLRMQWPCLVEASTSTDNWRDTCVCSNTGHSKLAYAHLM